MRSKYIAIEGNDGSGKSTLARHLAEHHGFKLQPFPTDLPIGRLIRKCLMGEVALAKESLLYLFAADFVDSGRVVKDMLDQGHNVVADRHSAISAMVFQTEIYSRDIVEMIYGMTSTVGTEFPAKVFVLEVNEETALSRMRGRDKYVDKVFDTDDLAVMRARNKKYSDLCDGNDVFRLDGTRPLEENAQIILDRIPEDWE